MGILAALMEGMAAAGGATACDPSYANAEEAIINAKNRQG